MRSLILLSSDRILNIMICFNIQTLEMRSDRYGGIGLRATETSALSAIAHARLHFPVTAIAIYLSTLTDNDLYRMVDDIRDLEKELQNIDLLLAQETEAEQTT